MKTIVGLVLGFILMSGLNAGKAWAQNSKILIVYFSQTQTTENVAQMIKENTGADIFRIVPKKAYPKDYKPLTEIGKREKEQKARPPLASDIKNIGQYDVIFIGFPTWWGDMPMILYTFLETHDLSGKTIILFNTHGGGGFPSDAVSDIERLQPKAKVNPKPFSISRNALRNSSADLKKWLKENGF